MLLELDPVDSPKSCAIVVNVPRRRATIDIDGVFRYLNRDLRTVERALVSSLAPPFRSSPSSESTSPCPAGSGSARRSCS